MRPGFMRLAASQQSGTGNIVLRDNELLGMIVASPSTAGVGDIWVYTDYDALTDVAHAFTNQYVGQIVEGPFEHPRSPKSLKALYYIITGTGVSVDFYAWADVEGRRWEF